jgi:hypothetical protein
MERAPWLPYALFELLGAGPNDCWRAEVTLPRCFGCLFPVPHAHAQLLRLDFWEGSEDVRCPVTMCRGRFLNHVKTAKAPPFGGSAREFGGGLLLLLAK